MKKNLFYLFALLLWGPPLLGNPPVVLPAYQLEIESENSKENVLTLNKHQTLLVTLKPQLTELAEVLDFKFDARMPQHKHGMVTQAKVEKIGPLKYRVRGVRLHMPGDWLLEFVIRDKKGTTRIEVPWVLAPQ